ncbi:hypothetical protein VFPFJ_01920 [Purpureocillium lilacinum]|uniref:Uncharacterized protein n=1 Tax=Purpureocillium lilacinum TaxID=33203 RepID=A0A179HTK8_PURLI|nr:hypothetical protein VFPFJ_01920 [Purpureocillium lilacinum]OAQ92759.1 hypothetical protein VFPFJ_01920 [Purpureocillium lilacinum]
MSITQPTRSFDILVPSVLRLPMIQGWTIFHVHHSWERQAPASNETLAVSHRGQMDLSFNIGPLPDHLQSPLCFILIDTSAYLGGYFQLVPGPRPRLAGGYSAMCVVGSRDV